MLRNSEMMRKTAYLDFWSGAKAYQSCRSCNMLQNATSIANTSFDTAENGLSRIWVATSQQPPPTRSQKNIHGHHNAEWTTLDGPRSAA